MPSLKGATLNIIAAAKKSVAISTCWLQAKAVVHCSGCCCHAEGVKKVLVADNAAYGHQLAENVAALVAEKVKATATFLACASTTGKDVSAARCCTAGLSKSPKSSVFEAADTFQRPIYAGNAIATVQSSDAIKVITVRPTAFDPVAANGGSAAVEAIADTKDAGVSSFVKDEMAKSDRPELGGARHRYFGWSGTQNGDNFEMLYRVADKLGAAVGASRAAVDAGLFNDMQVGQTGKIVAPQLYVAVGISGAIQHLAGMSGSKVIVAINKDEEAPIFQVADYGLVADLFEAVPALEAELNKVL